MFLTSVPRRAGYAVTATLLVVAVVGCSGDGNETQRYADRIRVEGFTLVKTTYADGEGLSYVGPAGDGVPAVTAPGLTLSSGGTDLSYLFYDYLATGQGTDSGTGTCRVTVYEIRDRTKAVDYLGDDLSSNQQQMVRQGTSRIVQIDVLCDAQADK
ncbi:hypothetical protein [Micromonospora sp. CV4]|uniref:hypothetical protein n=1 Tax=Micromonospora sp. CV4 TaxID=2478711 RepID=UPI000EF504D8|nr:hypothetical protein [Micromonospora sp. CV4]RLP94036.1 hypothetical protein EAD98_17830 [Micromonospora sp. CV4]